MRGCWLSRCPCAGRALCYSCWCVGLGFASHGSAVSRGARRPAPRLWRPPVAPAYGGGALRKLRAPSLRFGLRATRFGTAVARWPRAFSRWRAPLPSVAVWARFARSLRTLRVHNLRASAPPRAAGASNFTLFSLRDTSEAKRLRPRCAPRSDFSHVRRRGAKTREYGSYGLPCLFV